MTLMKIMVHITLYQQLIKILDKYEIRSKGYSRIDDELIEKHYSNIKKLLEKGFNN